MEKFNTIFEFTWILTFKQTIFSCSSILIYTKSFPRFTLLIPWIILNTSIISPLSCLCLRKNIPNFFNLSSYEKFLKLGIILVALLCNPYLLVSRTGYNTLSAVLTYDLYSFDITSADLYNTTPWLFYGTRVKEKGQNAPIIEVLTS